MKRFIAIMLSVILAASFCGCAKKAENETADKSPIVIIPDYNTKATVNGYKQFSSPDANEPTEENNISTEFYVNKSSKKFHLSNCSSAAKIKSENLMIANNRDELVSDGYEPCKICNP